MVSERVDCPVVAHHTVFDIAGPDKQRQLALAAGLLGGIALVAVAQQRAIEI